jgi:hypothetical protein
VYASSFLRRRRYAEKWGLNPWGRAVWGELGENNEMYGLTEEQLIMEDEAAEFDRQLMNQKFGSLNVSNRPEIKKQETGNDKARVINFSRTMLKDIDGEKNG